MGTVSFWLKAIDTTVRVRASKLFISVMFPGTYFVHYFDRIIAPCEKSCLSRMTLIESQKK